MLECRAATLDDWAGLQDFYKQVYRDGHPLRNREFWRWQSGSPEHGACFICLDQGKVVGQVGAVFGGGVAWIINVVLLPAYRGRGVLRELYGLARLRHPLAATNVNRPGLNMYRNMGWIRYSDLERFVMVNPRREGADPCAPVAADPAWLRPEGDHYWGQPGLQGVRLPDGSTGVLQVGVGGLRVIEIGDPETVCDLAWEAGLGWVDFMTSWNDPWCRRLEEKGWRSGQDSPVPWNLNPIDYQTKVSISFLAQEPLPKDLIVKRTYSDHGRVGSLPGDDR